jgi:tetratricopeptide (TPR) repeat protein
VNVLLHALNAVLLLLLFVRMTGALAPSAALAALFALHPLRVESVAWIAERKDVLSVCFGLLTLHAWVGWTRAPDRRRFGRVVVCTVLALLSKPMLVTLPVLLLVIDWWPLRRLGAPGPDGRPLGWRTLVLEKAPLFALALATAAITMLAAGADDAIMALDGRPLGTRLVHAVVSYAWYAWKTVWPTALAVFYPLPRWSAGEVAAASALAVAAVAVAVTTRRSAPWIAAGMAWFVIGLGPVIGLFQAGAQGMADRFTYIPGIGLAVAVVWSAHALATRRVARAALGGLAVLVAAVLGVATQRQASLWRTNETILGHTIAVTEHNWRTIAALANVLASLGRHAEAQGLFVEALRQNPDYVVAEYGLGLTKDALGRPDEAVEHYRRALRLSPEYWRAHNNLGVYLAAHGDLDGALHHFGEAVRLGPSAADAMANLRQTLDRAGFSPTMVAGYVEGLRTWSAAVMADRRGAKGASYGATLARALLAANADALRACLGEGPAAPFSLYLQIDAQGAVTAVTAMPPTPAARCVRDGLRTAHAPTPPFAPFHARVTLPLEG